MQTRLLIAFTLMIAMISCSARPKNATPPPPSIAVEGDTTGLQKAYFASGCFWCVEAIFESVKGVGEVISGYAGGASSDANYGDVSAGITDHAEAVLVYYDPKVISYETLLTVFFDSQDPTTPNRQGPDAGRQYRSAIFYTSASEQQAAQSYIKQHNNLKTYGAPIVTEVVAYKAFYAAEAYHQDYERRNPNQGYVKAVSVPRLRKFQARHPELLKSAAH
jgi:peptide-methionine (S)-S-oxide reductase